MAKVIQTEIFIVGYTFHGRLRFVAHAVLHPLALLVSVELRINTGFVCQWNCSLCVCGLLLSQIVRKCSTLFGTLVWLSNLTLLHMCLCVSPAEFTNDPVVFCVVGVSEITPIIWILCLQEATEPGVLVTILSHP